MAVAVAVAVRLLALAVEAGLLSPPLSLPLIGKRVHQARLGLTQLLVLCLPVAAPPHPRRAG